ncbi:MAG: nucleotidyl transferase AbiEii/AbiGii toxin family protein [Alphaproteobacteria bacterium]|nr:nucleotidyl transferase AbiEii/AbiGii toxin family protein [Alphaproteobacteria bacterium]
MIEQIAQLSENERKALFMEASSTLKMNAEMVEKDFWVCWVLNRIFSDDYLKKVFCFKGGTSLSKAYHLIERFSEDIDLILDWNTVSNGEEIYKQSKNQQNKRNEELLVNSQQFISTVLKDKIEQVVGDICRVTVDEQDKNNLQIWYPKGISGNYLLSYIKLEIGPLAAWMPNKPCAIVPYVNGLANNITFKDIIVPTIVAERTFWEKATILHSEHYRTSGIPDRYSRHYYDLYKMAQTGIKDAAFANIELLKAVVDFKQTFYYTAWAHYSEAKVGSFHLLPTSDNLKNLRNDYQKMHGMIFGDYPDFDEILASLKDLEQQINQL